MPAGAIMNDHVYRGIYFDFCFQIEPLCKNRSNFECPLILDFQLQTNLLNSIFQIRPVSRWHVSESISKQ